MGTTTFTGPIQAGDVLDTTGSTVGSLKNVGTVVTAQSQNITQAKSSDQSTAGLYLTNIVIPAGSQIVSIDLFVTAAWSGVASTLNVGTNSTATQLAVAADNTASAIGRLAIIPGANATRVGNWIDVGTSDVQIWVLSTNTGTGTGVLTVRYVQASNLTP